MERIDAIGHLDAVQVLGPISTSCFPAVGGVGGNRTPVLQAQAPDVREAVVCQVDFSNRIVLLQRHPSAITQHRHVLRLDVLGHAAGIGVDANAFSIQLRFQTVERGEVDRVDTEATDVTSDIAAGVDHRDGALGIVIDRIGDVDRLGLISHHQLAAIGVESQRIRQGTNGHRALIGEGGSVAHTGKAQELHLTRNVVTTAIDGNRHQIS